ncbi:U32 family peptidase [Geobacter sp. DSM 9736]|uniref:peptidase U32 family protein n=1 Tax=Geobacter sp. DSM 9736 TaxID=1277350 RepID=UPI000B502E36|nr:U32 family peptidase [Geobacter sp. DSM 9736]SNB47699.1 putative protease [Geobacter sp. DSM 9736]
MSRIVPSTVPLPELLAPAGSLEAFFAAMEKGADAVYAGLREFSARAKARNFSLDQMRQIVAYAHSLNRKVYVTLNTLVKEGELPQLVETLAELEAMGADAVIIQDLAVARLVRNFFPRLPLHASTQMTIHNSLGVKQLAELGFERVVLARELHVDEIRAIAAASPIGIECFIHGALCFSISGQCYFSSFLGGHSGNRGRCAQPCRRQYSYRGKEGYYFSTNDFSSIEMLPQLLDAGVSSLKIEGRMKSAEYVASVVSAYRLMLDAPQERRGEALAEAKELLKLSFGRVPTKGFLASRNPTDIATPSLKGATGRFLGEIKSVRGGRITFDIRDRLHVGDRIRIQPKSDMAGRAFTVKELFAGNQQVKMLKERSSATTVSPFACKVGDAVFKVSSETAFTMSEAACKKRLDAVRPGRLPCALRVSLEKGALVINAAVVGVESAFTFALGPLEPARTADMEGVLQGQFSRCGETPFELKSLSAPGFPQVLIPASRFKDIRREFYRLLEQQVLGQIGERRRRTVKEALAALVSPLPERSVQRAELAVRIEYLRDHPMLGQHGVDSVSVPVSKANLHQLPLLAKKLRGREDRVVWRLPFMIFEADLPFYRDAVKYIAQSGFRRFEAANLSHFPILHEVEEVEVGTDYRLFSVNSQALMSWRELGASACTLYLEDDAVNLGELLRADVRVVRRITVFSSIPAITSKIAIKSVRNDAPVVSDRGEQYDVTVKEGLTVVTPVKRFSLTHLRSRLQSMGCGSFVIDLTQEPKEEWQRILEAFHRGSPLPGTTEFNFTMGLV